jgi:hypothetical protein
MHLGQIVMFLAGEDSPDCGRQALVAKLGGAGAGAAAGAERNPQVTDPW